MTMKWLRRIPLIAAGILTAACNGDKTATLVAPRGPGDRPSFASTVNSGVNLDQWANGTGNPLAGASWQNGNLNGNNSTYGEGKVVPFRLAIEGLSAAQHFITIQHDFTAGGSKAYDFLTNADATESTIFSSICATGGGAVSSLCGSNTGAMPGTVPFVDVDYLTDTFEGPTGKTVSGAIGASSAAGTRKMRIYGISSLGQVSLSQMSHLGSFTGNSEAQFLVTFTPDVAGPVLMVWGGHLAESGYWDGPIPKGASTISGAPWHMRTQNLDNGGASNQDRSIQPSALVPPVLSITKAANPVGPVQVGTNIGFDITVTNNGPGSAFNVVIDDALPGKTGINWTTATTGCVVNGTPPTQTLHCTINTLLSTSGSNTFTASVTSTTGATDTTPRVCGTVTNSGAVASATNAAQVTSGSASVTVTCPDVSISKMTTTPTVSAGDNIIFDIVVANGGDASAGGVGFTDELPDVGGTWSIVSQTQTTTPLPCAITGTTLTCSGITLASTSGSYKVRVQSATTLAHCGTVNNTANLTSPFSGFSNASALVQCPIVSISKTAVISTVSAGDNVEFDIVASNTGAGVAHGVGFTDNLPSFGGTWSVVSQTQTTTPLPCAITGTTLTCSGITLAASNGSYTVRIRSTTDGSVCTKVRNTANLSSPFSGSAFDDVTVNCPHVVIAKTAVSGTVNSGANAQFDITVSNTGNAAASNVGFTDNLPSFGGTWSIASQTQTTAPLPCAISGSALTCAGITLVATTGSYTVRVSSTTSSSVCKAVENTVNLTSPLSGSDKATVTVTCPTIALTKTADSATVSAGSQIGFTVTVSNTGSGAATSVAVSDVLPTGTGISWSIDGAPTGWTLSTGTLSYSAPTLAVGASSSVHIISSTTASSCAKYDNTASATLTNGTAPADAKASITVQCPSVSLLKTAKSAAVDAGQQIGFDVTVSNASAPGTGTAKTVAVSDLLPGGTGINWTISPATTGWVITGSAPNQTLGFAATSLAPGASSTVHILSGTTGAVCKQYDNTATGTVGNGRAPDDSKASTTVHCLATLAVTKTIVGGGTTLFDFSQTGIANYQLTNLGSKVTSSLQPGTYRVCELTIPVGWTTTATIDGVAVVLTNPDAASDPNNQDLGNRCYDVPLTYGDSKTLAWTNKPPPGGATRTIGYWKNWSSCTGGGQYTKAVARNEVYATLDGNLPQTIGLLLLPRTTLGCQQAVDILNKTDINGTKLASDPAYNLAAQLLAAILNVNASAAICPAATSNISAAKALLGPTNATPAGIGFTGSGPFAKKMTAAQITQANALATKLDHYNNGLPTGCQ
jgi:uncharacterized repeat protein (TIGR01451 family)